MKKITKLIISIFYFYTKLILSNVLKIFGVKSNPVFTILYYHSIYQDEVIAFKNQLTVLNKLTKIVNLKDKLSLEKNNFYSAITFDDGFVNLLENALPVMEKMNIPAMIFIPTGFIGKKPEWDFEGYERDRKETVMNEEQIKNLNSKLFSIGSHTVSHPRLTKLNDDKIKDELYNSKIKLEDILDKKVTDLSFPHGEYNNKIVSEAFKIGYENLYTIIPENVKLNPDKNIMGRVSVTPVDWDIEFKLKIRGAYNWTRLIQRLKNPR